MYEVTINVEENRRTFIADKSDDYTPTERATSNETREPLFSLFPAT